MVLVCFIVKLLKRVIIINNTKSKYDKYIERILKEYDRFIANTKIGPIVNDGDKVIKLNDFQELLDVRDSFKVPINYYNIVSHQKCIFYLNKDNLNQEIKLTLNPVNEIPDFKYFKNVEVNYTIIEYDGIVYN